MARGLPELWRTFQSENIAPAGTRALGESELPPCHCHHPTDRSRSCRRRVTVYLSSMVLRPSVRFRARRSIRGTTTVSPGLSIPRSSFQEGRRMFLPEATSVKTGRP